MSGRTAPNIEAINPSSNSGRKETEKSESMTDRDGIPPTWIALISIIPKIKKTTPPKRCTFLFIIYVKRPVLLSASSGRYVKVGRVFIKPNLIRFRVTCQKIVMILDPMKKIT